MIYLDYAANTPVDDRVLNDFVNATKKYIANPNSNHAIGIEARREIEKCSIDIANYFKCSGDGIIYTSGSSESNNLVIKGIASMYKDKGKHIIISSLEHSSIVAPCNYLVSLGYDVSVVSLDNDGKVNLEEWIRELKDHIYYIHVHSNDGIYDNHQSPTTDEIENLYYLLNKYHINPILSLEYKIKDLEEEVKRYK